MSPVDNFYFLKAIAALNTETPVDTLKTLAEDRDPQIRLRVAQNPKLPKDVLEPLAKDDDKQVSSVALYLLGVRFGKKKRLTRRQKENWALLSVYATLLMISSEEP